jgi:hypothetical protein
VRFNGSSQIVRSYQMNDKIIYNVQWPKWDTHAESILETFDIAAYVPDTAKLVHGCMGLSAGTTARNMLVSCDSNGYINVGAICDAQGTGVTSIGVSGSKDFTLPMLTAHTLYWSTDTGTSADIFAVGITGYTDDL